MKSTRISTTKIAEICGVSQGTVDRALNNRAGINKNTKEKILSVAKEYGYRPMMWSDMYFSLSEKTRKEGYPVHVEIPQYAIDSTSSLWFSGIARHTRPPVSKPAILR